MNERIKELALKAEDFANRMWGDGRDYKWYEAYNAEFAELIVKECITLLPDDCQSKNGCHTSWVIKEHFGVEE